MGGREGTNSKKEDEPTFPDADGQADRMLDMGFEPQIRKILAKRPGGVFFLGALRGAPFGRGGTLGFWAPLRRLTTEKKGTLIPTSLEDL